MLTFEKVLSRFHEYLSEDTEVEVVLTRHGYALMTWDEKRKEWYDVQACETPADLMEALASSVESFTEWKTTGGLRKPTQAEWAAFRKKAAALKAACFEKSENA